MGRRLSCVEKRRRALNLRGDVLRLDERNTITEPISVVGRASGAFGRLARLGLIQVLDGSAVAEDLGEERGPRRTRTTRNERSGHDVPGDLLVFFLVSFRFFRGRVLALAAATVEAAEVRQRIMVNPGRSWSVVSDSPD
jgi:hypothetical protein